ncbi:hypothetical protein FOZ61_002115, partial [Perkinsus olseni]
SDTDPHHHDDDQQQQQQDPPARPDTAVTVAVNENRAVAEEGDRAVEESPTYEDLCEKGYLIPSGSGVGGGKSMDETVLRRGKSSGDDQTGTPEGVVKIFRQKADFEKGNVPAKILEESLHAVYAETIGHDVAEALKDDITLESVVEPEMAERAWDVVEEMNELTAEEQQLVKRHSEEFDQLVLCGEPPDLMEIDKKERKDGIDPSDVVLPPVALSVDYEPPVDGLDEVIAGQGDGVSSMDIPIKFEEEPLAGCVVRPDPPPPVNAEEDLPPIPPQKMIEISPVTMPPPEFFPDIIGPAKPYTLERMQEKQLPEFGVPLQPAAPLSDTRPTPEQFERDPEGCGEKLEVVLSPEPKDIWERDRGIDVNKLVHNELLPSIDAATLYGTPKAVVMDNGVRARLSKRIEDKLKPQTAKSFARFEWPAPALTEYPSFLVSLLREGFRCESAAQVISQRHEIAESYRKALALQRADGPEVRQDDHRTPCNPEGDAVQGSEAAAAAVPPRPSESNPHADEQTPLVSARGSSSRHSSRRSAADREERSEIAVAVKDAFTRLLLDNENVVDEIAARIKERICPQAVSSRCPAPPGGLLVQRSSTVSPGHHLIPTPGPAVEAVPSPGGYVKSTEGSMAGPRTIAPNAPTIEYDDGAAVGLPRDRGDAFDGSGSASRNDATFFNDIDNYTVERSGLPTAAYSRPDLDRHIRPNRGQLVQPDPSLIMDSRLSVQKTEEEDDDADSQAVGRVGALEDLQDDTEEKKGVEVLISCVRHNRYEAVESLLEEDRSLIEKVEAQQSNTLLMIACQNNNRRIAKYLLGCGVNIDAKNVKGNTALHVCYQFNHISLAEFLIANGADESVKNNDGVLPHMMRAAAPTDS